jgi:hypothetical protein
MAKATVVRRSSASAIRFIREGGLEPAATSGREDDAGIDASLPSRPSSLRNFRSCPVAAPLYAWGWRRLMAGQPVAEAIWPSLGHYPESAS